MKKVQSLLMTLALLIGVGSIVACNSLPTLQQQFNTFCPIVTADLQTISVSPLLNSSQQAQAKEAHDLNVTICTAGAGVDISDATKLANTLLPAVVDIIGAIPGFPQGTAIALALNTFGPLALQMGEQIAASVHGASSPVAASTPVPASQ